MTLRGVYTCASLLLAGCAGAVGPGITAAAPQSAAATVTRHRRGDSERSRQASNADFIFVSDSAKNAVDVFTDKPSPTLVTTIVDGVSDPAQITFDAAKTLYVVNQFVTSVSEYPAGQKHPSRTLTTGLQYGASGVAVDQHGTVYVSTNSEYATIVEYKRGQTAPYKTIRGVSDPVALAADAAGNVYVAAETAGVYELPAGSSKPKNLNLAGTGFVSGVAIDAEKNLYVASCAGSSSGSVLVYHSGQTISYQTIGKNGPCPYMISIGAKGDLYVPYILIVV